MTAPHCNLARAYARDVIAGKVPACRWVKLACERFERDLSQPDFPYRFDEGKAEKVCRLIERLPHVKGKWARLDPRTHKPQTIRLEAWQCFVLCNIFGWVRKDNGFRRFRLASVYVPRKNSKSTTAAGIGLYMLGPDDEPGAEVYSGATSEKQAWEVFRPAKQMAEAEKKFAQAGFEVNAANIIRESDQSRFLPVIGKPGDGASPHCAIVDEYHEHPTSELYDTMLTGMGAREQPLLLVISTAGSDLAGPCREDWKTCEAILSGTIHDETHFCAIWTIDDGMDWATPAALRMANPNFGVSVDGDFLAAQLAKAIRDPRAQNTFKTKHLNLWVSASTAYFNIQRWSQLAKPGLKRPEGIPCILADDFGNKSDLTCQIEIYPKGDEHYAVFCNAYLPRETVDEPENQHYRAWENGGWLTVTPGSVLDPEQAYDDAERIMREHGVTELVIDPNRAWGMTPEFQARGLPVVEYNLSAKTMSEPMRHVAALIKAGWIEHDGNPILTWAMGNIMSGKSRRDQDYPYKEGDKNKIDPGVALIMGFGRVILQPQGATGGFAFA